MCVDDGISRDEKCMDETSVGGDEDEIPGINNVPNIDDAFFEKDIPGVEQHLKSPVYRLLINPRTVTQKKLVTPKTVIRFCLERGIFTSSIIEFKLSRRPLEKFAGWARHMLGFPHVRTMLDQAQVTRAIQASGELFIYHDASGIVALFARWCIPTHTFICRWGEFTITLEDVAALMHLPITGNLPGDLSDEETAVSHVLTAAMEKANKAGSKGCYASWLTHWWPKDEVYDKPIDGMLPIAAFLCLWLSRDVFEDSGNLLKPFVIPFAIKMAQGEQLPIGTLFLGSLYYNLDSLIIDSSVSNGSMKIECYANTMFLQALMWENFKNYAPTPRNVLQGPNTDARHTFPEKDNARIMRWSTKQPRSKIRFIDVLDEESEFNFRP